MVRLFTIINMYYHNISCCLDIKDVFIKCEYAGLEYFLCSTFSKAFPKVDSAKTIVMNMSRCIDS